MTSPDWSEVEERLYRESVAAIDRFAAEHRGESVCYFAYDSEPYCQYVLICFDTPENSIAKAKRRAQRAFDSMQDFIERGYDWRDVTSQMVSVSLLPFTSNTGDFQYQGYVHVDFPGWEEFAESGSYPEGDIDKREDFLECNLAIVFWKVIDRLISEGQFAKLTLAAPFCAGYVYHDTEPVLLRILNWPAHAR